MPEASPGPWLAKLGALTEGFRARRARYYRGKVVYVRRQAAKLSGFVGGVRRPVVRRYVEPARNDTGWGGTRSASYYTKRPRHSLRRYVRSLALNATEQRSDTVCTSGWGGTKRESYYKARRAYFKRWKWYAGRANGQEQRIKTVQLCLLPKLRTVCSACGVVHEFPMTCGVTRLCPACCKKRKRLNNIRGGRGRIRAVQQLAAKHGFQPWYPGGRHHEYFLTITIPHFTSGELRAVPDDEVCACKPGDDCLHRFRRSDPWGLHGGLIGKRIDVLFVAFRHFAKMLHKELRRQHGKHVFFRWIRAFEWIAARDDKFGHPHFHFYVLAPWLPISDEVAGVDRGSRRWKRWKKAHRAWKSLEPRYRAGAQHAQWVASEPEEPAVANGAPRQKSLHGMMVKAYELAGLGMSVYGPKLQLDLRKIETPREMKRDGFLAEIFKGSKAQIESRYLSYAKYSNQDYMAGWTVAELANDPEVSPEQAAEVYRALEGRRITGATKELLVDDKEEGCSDCQARKTVHVEVLRPWLEGEGRTGNVDHWDRSSSARQAHTPP